MLTRIRRMDPRMEEFASIAAAAPRIAKSTRAQAKALFSNWSVAQIIARSANGMGALEVSNRGAIFGTSSVAMMSSEIGARARRNAGYIRAEASLPRICWRLSIRSANSSSTKTSEPPLSPALSNPTSSALTSPAASPSATDKAAPPAT